MGGSVIPGTKTLPDTNEVSTKINRLYFLHNIVLFLLLLKINVFSMFCHTNTVCNV